MLVVTRIPRDAPSLRTTAQRSRTALTAIQHADRRAEPHLAGVVEIPKMQELLRYICENGFEHHVATSFSSSAAAIHEAATKYLNWSTYWHK